MNGTPRIGPGFDPSGHDADDETIDDGTATALRGALFREAERTVPAPDGLQRIQREISARQAGRHGSPRARFVSLVTAAAAAAALIVAGTVAVRINQQPPVLPARTSATPEAPKGSVPVYVIGRQGDRTWLFREFWQTRVTRVEDKVAEAVTDAVNRRPLDPDYDAPVFQGGAGSRASATVTDALITVTLTAAMVSRPDVSRADAELALQQLVWTATAAAGTGRADTPVLIRVDKGNQMLFGRIRLDRRFARTDFPDDPRAPLWITSLADGVDVGHKPLTVTGDTVADGGSVTWSVTRDGVELAAGDAAPGDTVGGRTGWSVRPPTGGMIGTYLLTLTLHPSPGSGLSTEATWQDTRVFRIR